MIKRDTRDLRFDALIMLHDFKYELKKLYKSCPLEELKNGWDKRLSEQRVGHPIEYWATREE